jgi:hypothetical protein
MSVPVAVVAARVAAVLLDDILEWAIRIGIAALLLLLIPLSGVVLGFGGLLALFGGLSGTADGGGPVWGGPPTSIAVGQIPAEQLIVMQQAAKSAPCTLPWTVLAAIASIESEFGRTADHTSSAGAYGYGQFLSDTWPTFGGDIPWRTTDKQELSKPFDQRRDSTNYHFALPAMARYLCAEGAGQDLRRAIYAYNHSDSYVVDVVQRAARYGGIGAAGGRLIDGWADRPPLNQFERRNYGSDQAWLTWRKVDCSAAALDWLLGAYGQPPGSIDDAIAIVGPNTGISTTLGLLDARGPALASALSARGLTPRQPHDAAGRLRPLASVRELQSWLDQGPLLMDGAAWFGEGHWFVGVAYDSNGVYIRDSSGWDTRYLPWSRLYGEVGFSGWVVGVAA